MRLPRATGDLVDARALGSRERIARLPRHAGVALPTWRLCRGGVEDRKLPGGVGTGVVTGMVLRGNVFINAEDPDQPKRARCRASAVSTANSRTGSSKTT
jgi:hypothetical protein